MLQPTISMLQVVRQALVLNKLMGQWNDKLTGPDG